MEVSERYFPDDKGRVLYKRMNYHGGIVRGRRNFSLMGVGASDSIWKRSEIEFKKKYFFQLKEGATSKLIKNRNYYTYEGHPRYLL